MTDDSLLPDAARALQRTFGDAATDPGLPDTPPSLNDVRAYLVTRITELLDQNPSLLMSRLYRIDVAEDAVKDALRHAPPAELPGVLADLVIERQLQKLRYRRR